MPGGLQAKLIQRSVSVDIEGEKLSSWLLYDKNDTRLSSLLWSKLRPYTTGRKRIDLTPCGILNRVNFQMFDANIYELSSVSELIRSYSTNPRSSALLIGDIDYDQSTMSTIRGERDWGTLNGTRLEIESIAKTLSARYAVTKLTKDAGSEQAVRKLCNASPKILHFATHAICYTDQLRRSKYGYFDFPYNYYPERPELTYTGLVLSGGNMGFKRTGNRRLDNDGILLSEEISKLHLEGTDLAVLSACNSAIGIFDDIDGTLGLGKPSNSPASKPSSPASPRWTTKPPANSCRTSTNVSHRAKACTPHSSHHQPHESPLPHPTQVLGDVQDDRLPRAMRAAK